MKINELGFLRVAASSPKLKVADCDFNISEIKTVVDKAISNDVQILCFPELSITSYSCADLFFQQILLDKALLSLIELSEFVKLREGIVVIVGLPMRINNSLYNIAAILSGDGISGLVPKTYLANSGEFQEKRWFTSSKYLKLKSFDINGKSVPIAQEGMIFNTAYGNFSVEICEDLWMRIPPSSEFNMNDADVIFNLSASNELIAKNRYRKSLVLQQSARCNSAYVYSSASVGESTTDLVYSGACFIAENGELLSESKRFSLDNEIIISDVDIFALRHDKLTNTNYNFLAANNPFEIDLSLKSISTKKIYRTFSSTPFIPSENNKDEDLSDLFQIQMHSLAKRLLHTGADKSVIGISGGLDSTLTLLVTIKVFDKLGISRKNIHGITMPGFGTSKRTYTNAVTLMESLGISIKEISITDAVAQHFNDIDHDINIHDITYENSQARERTQILMDYANKIGGLVIGTGNMSELALGWTTFNADHMSMYSINSGIPKTLVSTFVRWIADKQLDETSKSIVYDIIDTPFSPELLPADEEGEIAQKTEDSVGPYELHDFFMYRMIRYGDTPHRILFISRQAFKDKYTVEEIKKWIKVFYKRFFSQQFKRSCMPDGPKVGSVNLSPRGSWRMPSDAVVKAWLEDLE